MDFADKGHNVKEILTSEPSLHPWKQSCFHSKPWTGSGHDSLTCGVADASLTFFSKCRGVIFFFFSTVSETAAACFTSCQIASSFSSCRSVLRQALS